MKQLKYGAIASATLLLTACGSTSDTSSTSSHSNTSNGGKPIIIADSVPYASNANVPHAVKSECATGPDFAKFLKSYARSQGFDPVSKENAPTGALTLDVKIDHVYAPQGGAWTGPKYVTALGKLVEGGKEVGNFRIKRTTSGGAFAAFKGTCSFVGRNVKAMAIDISRWLNHPSKDSRLGEY